MKGHEAAQQGTKTERRNKADARFNPDIIFWLQMKNQYHIVFVDPKGTEHAAGLRKLDGYRRVFENRGTPKLIWPGKAQVNVHAFLYTPHLAQVPVGYRRHWFDNAEDLLKPLAL